MDLQKIREHLESKSILVEDIEQVKADFYDEKVLIEPAYYNYRVNVHGERLYARIMESGEIRIAPSWSAVSSQTIPKNSALFDWAIELGKDEYWFWMNNSAHYGTFLHVLFGRLLRGEEVWLDETYLFAVMEQFYIEAEYDFKEGMEWYRKERAKKARNIKNDVIGFLTWVRDWKVEPVALEYPVFDYDKGYVACTIDLIAYVGEGKDLSIIDFKTGYSGFYESSAYQLLCAQYCWNQEYEGDLEVKRIFNYGCNSFRLATFKKYIEGGAPGNFKPYQFKEWTGKVSWEALEYYFKLYELNNTLEIKPKMEYKPDKAVSIKADLSDIVIEESPLDYIKEIAEEDKKEAF